MCVCVCDAIAKALFPKCNILSEEGGNTLSNFRNTIQRVLLLNIDVTHMVSRLLTFERKLHNAPVPCSTVNSCYITLESFSLKPIGVEVNTKSVECKKGSPVSTVNDQKMKELTYILRLFFLFYILFLFDELSEA